jgi:hypothetical protein
MKPVRNDSKPIRPTIGEISKSGQSWAQSEVIQLFSVCTEPFRFAMASALVMPGCGPRLGPFSGRIRRMPIAGTLTALCFAVLLPKRFVAQTCVRTSLAGFLSICGGWTSVAEQLDIRWRRPLCKRS